MGTSRMAAVTLERANGTAPSVELREGVLRCQRSLFAMLSFFEQPAYTAFEVERALVIETIQSGCLADAILALEIIEPLPAAAVTAKKPPKSARVRAAHPVITGVETADRIAARGKTLSVLELSLATADDQEDIRHDSARHDPPPAHRRPVRVRSCDHRGLVAFDGSLMLAIF